MSTQTDIVQKIVKNKGHYCLAVEGNQKDLLENIESYMNHVPFQKDMKEKHHYKRTIEQDRRQVETREYLSQMTYSG